MNFAKVIEISAESDVSFEAAVQHGISKASETIQNIKGAWVKEQKVSVRDGMVTGYRVILKVTFIVN